MHQAKPEPEHLWLQKLVGTWTYESGDEKSKMTGTETVRTLDGLWVVCEGSGEMGGEPATMIMTLGFNPKTKRYTGTWIGSMMTHLWIYDGHVEGNTLFLESEGPGMPDAAITMKYRDSIEFVDANHRILRGEIMKDGEWSNFMTTHYRRKLQ